MSILKQHMRINNILLGLLVLLISFGGASYCGYLLYEDIYVKKQVHIGEEAAGIVFEKQLTVKRKSADSLLWELVATSDKLFWNDSVQSGEGSEALLSLKDGNTIRMGESSLIVLEKDADGLSLKLKSGQLVVDSSKTSGGAKSQLKVNGMTLAKSAGDGTIALNLDEKQGDLVATTTLADGTAKQVTVDKTGHVEEKILPAFLVSPSALYRTIIDTPRTVVQFSWSSKPGTKKLFEIARDKNFEKPVLQKTMPEDKLNVELNQGFYYWRVTTQPGKKEADQKPLVSETRSLSVIYAIAPEPILPEPAQKITFVNELPAVEFSWKGNPAATLFVIEIANDTEFKNIFLKQETTNRYFRTSQLHEGTLNWRVTALYNDKVPRVSASRQLTIQKLREIPPAHLISPEPNWTLTLDAFEAVGGVPFKWTNENNEHYKFVYSHSPDLHPAVNESETTQSEFLIREKPTPGIYYWTVAHKGTDGQWKYPEIRKFTVGDMTTLPAGPKITGPGNLATIDLAETPKIKLQWTEVPGTVRYHLKVSKLVDGQEQPFADEFVSTPIFEKAGFGEGTYKWKVTSVDQASRESRSVESQFVVKHVPLEAPDFEMAEVQ